MSESTDLISTAQSCWPWADHLM